MSPRATSTEEPDGGNLLVRIWRGAGVGNLPAYSTPPTLQVGGFVSYLTGFAYSVSGLLLVTLSSAGSVLTQQRHSWHFARSW